MNFAVFQIESVAQSLHIFFGNGMVEHHFVDFLLTIFRVCHFRGQIAIVGQQQHAGGIAVEPSDGIDAFAAGVFHQVEHRHACLWVVHGGNTVFRFVQQDVNAFFAAHQLVVEQHLVGGRHYFCTQFGYHFAIHGYHAGGNVFIGFAARTNARICQKFIQAHRFVVVDILFFVGHLLFVAVLGVFVEVGIVLPTIRCAVVVVAVALFVAVEARAELTAIAAAVAIETIVSETCVRALFCSIVAFETRTLSAIGVAFVKTVPVSVRMARLLTVVVAALFIAVETWAKLAILATATVARIVKLTSVTIAAGTATVVITARPKFIFVCHKI